MPHTDHLDHHEQRHGAIAHRELFWQNVLREALTSLSVQAMMIRAAREQAQRLAMSAGGTQTLVGPGLPSKGKPLMRASAQVGDEDEDEDAGAEGGEEFSGHMLVPETDDEQQMEQQAEDASDDPFDGRLGVITTQGMRIPIADVYPLFACSVPGSPESRAMSEEVQCTVFQIRTPGGEIYTLPLAEIRGLHGANPNAMAEFEAGRAQNGTGESKPFGYAAFTSLAREEARKRGEVSG